MFNSITFIITQPFDLIVAWSKVKTSIQRCVKPEDQIIALIF